MTSRHDAVDHAMNVLDRELAEERFATVLEMRAERFGAPEIVPAPTCWACSAPITKCAGGWWVHMGPTPCSRVVVTLEEVEG